MQTDFLPGIDMPLPNLAPYSELIIDAFAGGGGASSGIERALGRSPDIAINHCDKALTTHAANHPQTIHLREDIFQVDLKAYTNGLPVGLLWASPDCRHFSKAGVVGSFLRKCGCLRGLWFTSARSLALGKNLV